MKSIHNGNNPMISKHVLLINEMFDFIHKFYRLCIFLIYSTRYCE
jgi:hypothetical protein